MIDVLRDVRAIAHDFKSTLAQGSDRIVVEFSGKYRFVKALAAVGRIVTMVCTAAVVCESAAVVMITSAIVMIASAVVITIASMVVSTAVVIESVAIVVVATAVVVITSAIAIHLYVIIVGF